MRYIEGLLYLALLIGAVTPVAGVPDDPSAVEAAPEVRADPSPIRLPSGAMLPPSASVKLTAGVLYVVDSKVKVLVRPHPAGLVTVQEKKGPRDITAKFVDGAGTEEDRTYEGPFLYVIKANGKGRVEVDFIPYGFKDAAEIVTATIEVDSGQGPIPPPVPPDPKPPDPKPPDPVNPAPIPVDGFRVLIVYDRMTLGTIPASQNAILFSAKIDAYLRSHCVKGPDGVTPECRQYSTDAAVATEAKLWRDAFARPRTSLPWILISTGKTGFEGLLPLTVDETLALLKKYGGD